MFKKTDDDDDDDDDDDGHAGTDINQGARCHSWVEKA